MFFYVSIDPWRPELMRSVVGAFLLSLMLVGCGSTLSDQEAQAVCTEWIERSRPGFEITLGEPAVAEEGRLVVIDGEAVKGEETVDTQCAVDIRKGEVVAGFN
jgi:hypothetical protein